MQLSGRPLLGTALDAPLFVGREIELAALQRSVGLGLNALVLGARGAGTTSLLHELARRLREGGGGGAVVDARRADGVMDLLGVIAARVPGEGAVRDDPAAAIAGLRAALSDQDAPAVVLVDQPAPAVAHALFGRMRDEVWTLPATWVVSGLDSDRAALLTPPADAFFETVVTLPPLTPDEAAVLLRRRIAPADADDATLAEIVAGADEPTPRAVLARARERLVEGRSDDSLRHEAARWDAALADLPAPSKRLLGDLQANGPASASDPDLLRRLGWSRSRAAQVLGDLDRRGLVRAGRDRPGATRPRKVYAAVEPDRLPGASPGERVRHGRAGLGEILRIHQDDPAGPTAEVAFADGARRVLPLADLQPHRSTKGPDD